MAPLAPIRIGQGEGAATPPLLPSLLSSFPLLLLGLGKVGDLLLLGVGVLPLGAPPLGQPFPPLLIYIQG